MKKANVYYTIKSVLIFIDLIVWYSFKFDVFTIIPFPKQGVVCAEFMVNVNEITKNKEAPSNGIL